MKLSFIIDIGLDGIESPRPEIGTKPDLIFPYSSNFVTHVAASFFDNRNCYAQSIRHASNVYGKTSRLIANRLSRCL